jgi:hypothetical protein
MGVPVVVECCSQETGPELHEWRNEKRESHAAAEKKTDEW